MIAGVEGVNHTPELLIAGFGLFIRQIGVRWFITREDRISIQHNVP